MTGNLDRGAAAGWILIGLTIAGLLGFAYLLMILITLITQT